MIYLAILLILSGLLILITALFIEKSGKASSDVNQTRDRDRDNYDQPVYTEPEDMEILFPDERISSSNELFDHTEEEDIFISFNDGSDLSLEQKKSAVNEDWGIGKDEWSKPDPQSKIVNLQKVIDDDKEDFPPVKGDGIRHVSAIMFDDRSNIIDYESGGSVIDSTFAKYKSIKRIGKGRLEADADGLNFFLGEKLYRFDFHKVYDIWSGDNFIALPLKGSSNVKLFLIENPGGFPEKIELYFKEYEKGL